jgi:hypothetical protein
MKKTLFGLLIVILLLSIAGCGRGEGGGAGYGAGGGQSLRQGSTSPLHSPIAQDATYQKLLGLNILLYPPPVDDPKFEPFGAAHWDLDAKAYVEMVKSKFSGEKGKKAVYEPVVDGLADDPLIKQIQDTIYEGKPIQVGWVYGDNDALDYLEYNAGPVTLITTENALVFAGDKAELDPTNFTFDVKDTKAFFIPANAVVTLKPDTLHSAPIRVTDKAGQLTVVILPEGTGVEKASPGSGMDQALVAKNRWIWAFPDNLEGFFAGLTGSNKSIVPAD